MSFERSETAAPQQALTVLLCVRADQSPALVAELSALKGPFERALATIPHLHFARAALLPGAEGALSQLLFESSFDGSLAAHLRALWASASAAFAAILSHCEGGEGITAYVDFAALLERHMRRPAALYQAQPRLSVALIRNDALLDQTLQDYVRSRGRERAESVLKVACELQAHVRTLPELWLGRLARRTGSAEPGRVSLLLERAVELSMVALLRPWLELCDHLREGLAANTAWDTTYAVDGTATATVGSVVHLVPLRPGRLRARWLRLGLDLADRILTARGDGLRVAPTLRSARWVLLPDARLLFLGSYDGVWPALLAAVSERGANLVNLIWAHTRGFPATRGLCFGGARRRSHFQRWSLGYQVPTQIWYSAYPSLTVIDIQRNCRLRELLAMDLDERRALELCRLL